MIIIGLIALGMILYWVGGEKWAHTLFRDAGCPACIMAIAIMLLGFHWALLAIVPIAWGGMTIGDHERWQWSIHAFVISLCMLPFAIAFHTWLAFGLMITSVTLATYLTSRFFSNKLMLDVWCRGILYATIPVWFMIK